MKPTGKIQEFLQTLEKSLIDGRFAKLSLGHYGGAEEALQNIHIKKAFIKKEEKLSFTYRYKTKDIVKNYSFPEGIEKVRAFLKEEFFTATLFTTDFDLVYDAKKSALHKNKASIREIPSLDHNRSKKRLIDAKEKPYLHALNITDAAGNVFPTAQDKYRQINRYVEILSTLIKNIPADRLKKVVDMGSGKGYLTFALYDYLHNVLKLQTQVTGVEYRADLVALCNRIAKESNFDSLYFEQGTIENFDSAGTNILIALHACDTATDDAICKGITAQADLIVVAPCCHKQIRREMEKHKSHNDLDFITKHGIFLERQAEMVTDGMRAMILEYFGYSTKVFEFISDAHTAKNVLIVGTRNGKTGDKAALAKLKETKAYFGIGYHYLEQVIGL